VGTATRSPWNSCTFCSRVSVRRTWFNVMDLEICKASIQFQHYLLISSISPLAVSAISSRLCRNSGLDWVDTIWCRTHSAVEIAIHRTARFGVVQHEGDILARMILCHA
jgi:hypothetical protein